MLTKESKSLRPQKFSRVQTSARPRSFDFFTGFDFDVNKMFVNTTWTPFNVNDTRSICVNFVGVESIKTARTNYGLGRVKEGSVPHVRSLTKYNITRDDINDLRRRNGHDDLIENIPYWAEATRLRRRNMEDPSRFHPRTSSRPVNP